MQKVKRIRFKEGWNRFSRKENEFGSCEKDCSFKNRKYASNHQTFTSLDFIRKNKSLIKKIDSPIKSIKSLNAITVLRKNQKFYQNEDPINFKLNFPNRILQKQMLFSQLNSQVQNRMLINIKKKKQITKQTEKHHSSYNNSNNKAQANGQKIEIKKKSRIKKGHKHRIINSQTIFQALVLEYKSGSVLRNQNLENQRADSNDSRLQSFTQIQLELLYQQAQHLRNIEKQKGQTKQGTGQFTPAICKRKIFQTIRHKLRKY